MREEFIRDLYEQYFETVKKYCLPRLRFDEGAAAECAHAVFEEAERHYEKLRGHPKVLGWLIQTAKNKLKKSWRKSIRDAAREVPLELAASVPDGGDPFDAVELPESEIERITEEVLSCLDERERRFYDLFFKEGLSFEETGRMFGVSEKAARAKLARIKLKLKQRIIYLMDW